MAVVATRQLAAAELRQFVKEEGAEYPALQWVWRALQSRGKLLASDEGFAWGMLPLEVCEAAGGDPHLALPLSSALECLMAAADTIDDIQDGDDADALWLACGIATATNVSGFLFFLTQLALSRLADLGIPVSKVVCVSRVLAAAGARACIGQQRDLDYSSEEALSESAYLETIALKSAALVEGACRAAAVLGTDDSYTVDAFARFGHNLGMAMQIRNDLVGLSTESTRRGDIVARKRTLPVIFALRHAPAAIREELNGILWPGRPYDLQLDEAEQVRDLVEASGALLYGTAVSDLYWERSLTALEAAGCSQASLLVRLVSEMRHA